MAGSSDGQARNAHVDAAVTHDGVLLGQTPSQTVGPYFAYGLTPSQYGYGMPSLLTPHVAAPETEGLLIRIIGQVLDSDGEPIDDAMIEWAQVDAAGAMRARQDAMMLGFRGFGRCGTGATREKQFEFRTVKPGPEAPGLAPAVNLIVMMRGLLSHVFTRIYFSDEAAANALDPILRAVPEARQTSLIAQRIEGQAMPAYRIDIRMSGAQETVFFDR